MRIGGTFVNHYFHPVQFLFFDETIYACSSAPSVLFGNSVGLKTFSKAKAPDKLPSKIASPSRNRSTGTLTATVEADQVLTLFISANDTSKGAIALTRLNSKNTYFAFDAANADGGEHIRSRGSDNQQTFDFETYRNGGNKRFDDVVVSAEIVAI